MLTTFKKMKIALAMLIAVAMVVILAMIMGGGEEE